VLELVDKGSELMDVYEKEGLHFTPLRTGVRTTAISTHGASPQRS